MLHFNADHVFSKNFSTSHIPWGRTNVFSMNGSDMLFQVRFMRKGLIAIWTFMIFKIEMNTINMAFQTTFCCKG